MLIHEAWGRIMTNNWKSAWESMSIEELFTLRELMQEVLIAKLKDKQLELRRKQRTLNQLSIAGAKPKKIRPAAD